MSDRLTPYRESFQALYADPPEYDRLREELGEYRVELVADVTKSGVLAINSVIAEVNAFKDRVFGIISGVQEHLDMWDDLYSDVAYIYRDSFDRALLQEGTIELRSNELREAKARRETASVQDFLNDIDYVSIWFVRFHLHA